MIQAIFLKLRGLWALWASFSRCKVSAVPGVSAWDLRLPASVGALMIRIGFGSILYYSYSKKGSPKPRSNY